MVVTGPGPGHLASVSIGFIAVSGVIVAARLYTRLGIVRRLGIDDVFILLGLVFSIAVTTMMMGQVKHGIGRNLGSLPPRDITSYLQHFWASIWLYNLTICCTKLSILLQYLRVWTVERRFRVLCFTMIGFIIAVNLWTVFGSVWLCIPAEKFWQPQVIGRCQNLNITFFANAGLNILTDFILILMPMPLLKALQLPQRQKIAVTVVFAVGFFVCIVSFIRLRYLARIAHTSNPTRDNVNAATWSVIEINVGIVCASLPCLRVFMSRLFPSFMSTNRSHESRPTWGGIAHTAGSTGASAVRATDDSGRKGHACTQSVTVWAEEQQELDRIERVAMPAAILRDMEAGQISVTTVTRQEYETCSLGGKSESGESERRLVPARTVGRFT